MNKEVEYYIEKYPEEVKELYAELRHLIIDCAGQSIEEKLRAKLPSYYVGQNWPTRHILTISFEQ